MQIVHFICSTLYVYMFCSSDIIFVQGTEVIFKVAICLLANNKEQIMACDNFESIVDFLKINIPDMTKETMEKMITQVTWL